MTPSDKALSYAQAVVAGLIPNCKWVRLACKRFIDDLARAYDPVTWPYVYDSARGDRFVNFAELFPHVKGRWATGGQTIKYEDWQCFIDCNLFGWINKKSKLRRFRTSFELIPRKNAKSTKAALRGIYMFVADNENGAEVYSGATTEKQALEVFRPAWGMVNKLKTIQAAFQIEQTGNAKNPGTMFVVEDMSKFELLIGKPGDGASPHHAIIDEYHEHDSDHMVDAMQTGMGAREQPLLSVITTAGSNLNGPCYEMQQDMQKILEGVVKDETRFAIMYGIDEEDKWDDPASLIKANPNYGISIFPEFLLSQLAAAKRSASKQNSFRTKHLNEWVGATTAWMNMSAWSEQVAYIHLKTGKIGSLKSFQSLAEDGIHMITDPDIRRVVMDDFKEDFCHVAGDLSSKLDVTAVDITFERGDQHFTFKKFFVPEAATETNEKYLEFSENGYLELTDGVMMDQEVIEDYLIWLCENFKVIDIAFDAWNADYMMTRLMKKNVDVVKFPFNTKFISGPMKTIEAEVLAGKYWHDGNPVMDWMVGNVAANVNDHGETYPKKARKNDPTCKIDGIAVAIMSMGRWQVQDEPEPEFQFFTIG